jgi:membrane-bound lytic murein transglycosylase D
MTIAARACAVVPLLLGGAFARAAAPPQPLPAAKRSAPVEESLSERRAVRGSPVDDLAGGESPELREIRRFEEQAFPRPGAAPALRDDGSAPPVAQPGRAPELPNGASLGLPPELRSPETQPRASSAPLPPAPDSDWLRSLKLPDLPVHWDAQVLRYLDYFKNDPKGRAVMTSWLRRSGRFRDLFEKTLEREGLPKDLVYVAMVESGFDPGARSRAGAGGIWQFMPGAARAYGLEVSYWVDARRDPVRSATAAARYLKDLYVRFGSWHLVFAAYNAGYGAVLRAITSYNTNDFWELIRHEAGLPWESSIYVPKILAAAIVGHNLEAFGYGDITPDPPFAYEEVESPPGTTIATIARAAATRAETIEALNPELVRDRTAPDRKSCRVRIPVTSTESYAASFEKARTAGDRLETVVLRFGETLDDVAKTRGLAVRDLRRLNGVKDTSELRAGVTIVVPRRGGGAATGSAAVATARGGADRDEPDDLTIVAVPDRTFSYEGRERVFYRTRDGDSIDEIADTFGVRADELVDWNNVDADAKLHPRMVLQIYVRKDFDPAGVLLLDPATVRVVTLGSDEFLELEAARRGKKRLLYSCKTGDTLIKVGRRYGLTPGDLARINRFSYNTELHDGQRIVVYSPTGDAPREITMGMTPEPKRPKPGAATTKSRAAGVSPPSHVREAPKASGGHAIAAKAGAASKRNPHPDPLRSGEGLKK